MHPRRSARCLALAPLLVAAGCATPPEDDPDTMIRADMLARWQAVERRTWTIDYRTIDGLEAQSAWHITGTQWWVRLLGEVWTLDELDPSVRYEIDGTAVDQNYGVISIYPYWVEPVAVDTNAEIP